MPSEARRGAARIITNYARLLATVVMGIVLVPVQLAWLGNDGFALLALLGASVGLAGMLQDVMRHSMVRELGAAWHDEDDPTRFERTYASAFVICAIVTALTAGVFVLIFLIVPVLRMPDHFVGPARWFLAAEGISTCALVALSPAFNMYVVTERFGAHNFWTAARRAALLVSALVLFLVFRVTDPARGLALFGIVEASLATGLLLIAVALIVRSDRRLRPHPSLVRTDAMREVAGTFGWNSAVILAMNLHERLGAFIMNGVFGLWGNAIFGLALRLTSYVRMMTLGMTFGLDAVSARLTTSEDHDTLRTVVGHSTRLHGYVALPGALVVFVMAEPLLRLWVGRYVQDPDPESGRPVLAAAEALVRILMAGMASRAIADGWMKLLYGAGHIRRYAPVVLVGGVLNPVTAFLLIALLPDTIDYTAVAWAFTGAFVVIHLGLLPIIGARALGTTWWTMVAPLGRPLVIAAAPAPLLFLPRLVGVSGPIGWTWLLVSCGAYGLVYLTLGFFFGLSRKERGRAMRMARRSRAQS